MSGLVQNIENSVENRLKEYKLPLYNEVLKDLDYIAISSSLKEKNILQLSRSNQNKIF